MILMILIKMTMIKYREMVYTIINFLINKSLFFFCAYKYSLDFENRKIYKIIFCKMPVVRICSLVFEWSLTFHLHQIHLYYNKHDFFKKGKTCVFRTS